MRTLLLTLALLLLSAPVSAQDPAPTPDPKPSAEGSPEGCEGTCVADEDMQKILRVLRERKCLNDQPPTFELDPVNIVIDKDGRVFFSGEKPHPYTLKMKWCHYEVEAQGKVDVIAAVQEPPVWGFRFRPKAYIGVLPLEPFYELAAGEEREFADVMDAGVMVDFLYYQWANLNVAVGYRSLGGGVGFDLTSNFGAYVGYGLTWIDWHHNANLGLWFSFWNP